MAGIIWSEKQKEIIEQHRNSNLLVSAAAGSGKTTVLTERIARICEEGTSLENILIMTFTNAAASKMKADILKRTDIPPFTKTYICTFDKFCIDIYRQYYHVIGEKPGLKICDDLKNTLLKDEACEELFTELFEKNDEGFRDFLDRYCDSKTNNAAKDIIFRFYEFIQNMPDPDEWIERLSSGEMPDESVICSAAAEEARRLLEDALSWLDKIEEVLSDGDPEFDHMPLMAEKNRAAKAAVYAVLEMFEQGRDASDLAAAAENVEFPQYRAAKDEKPYWEAVKQTAGKLKAKAKDQINAASGLLRWIADGSFEEEKKAMLPHIRTICRLTREFEKIHTAKKRKAGLMDFSDSAHFALRILKDPDVCAEFRNQFRYIFIDEYQDSNYVQEALINSICRENNVFMVGDIKQGIYEFRFAETEIFLDKYKRYKSGSESSSAAVDLNQNYRSKRPVIDFVNKVFIRTITEETMGMRYDESAMLHEGDHPYRGELEYSPRLYLISSEVSEEDELDESIAELKKMELEALNAVSVIKEYHGKLIDDKGTERPLKYSDMVVLLRGVKKGRFAEEGNGEIFYRTFMEHGIPVYLERSEGYFDAPEVQVFLNLLRIIDNPRNDVPLLSVMHFPGFGFTADELAEIKIHSKKTGRRTSFYEALAAFESAAPDSIEDIHLREKTDRFLEKLTRWRRAASCTPVADILWNILSESGVADFARALPGGAQRIANLRAMADKAQEFQSEGEGGIGDFVRYIDHYKKSRVDTGQAGLLSEDDDVVRIMTIHKSKGLEFPFVMLCGLGSSLLKASSRAPFLYHRRLGAAVKLFDPKLQIRTTPRTFSITDKVIKNEEYAENIRVLYVAATRARDILIMSGSVKNADSYLRDSVLRPRKAASYLDMILPVLSLADIKRVDRAQLAPSSESSTATEEVLKGIREGFGTVPDPALISVEDLKNRLYFKPEKSDLSKKKYSVSELMDLKRSSDGKEHPVRFRAVRSDSGLSAAEKGNAYHAVMEHIPFTSDGKSEPEIAGFIQDLRSRNIISAQQADAVDPARIAAFFRSDIGQRAVSAKEIHKEAPFIMKSDLNGHEILVQGIIDCYFTDGDGYVLLDYKSNYADTDSPEEEKQRLKEYYMPQLQLYKEALEGISGIPVMKSCLYLFSLDDYVLL